MHTIHGSLCLKVMSAAAKIRVVTCWGLQVDVAVMEAGLGGSHDATNVFDPEQILATVVTAIDVEHLDALGPAFHNDISSPAAIVLLVCFAQLIIITMSELKLSVCRRHTAEHCQCKGRHHQARLPGSGRPSVTCHC